MKQTTFDSPLLESRRSNAMTLPCSEISIGAQSAQPDFVRELELQAFVHYYEPVSRLVEESAKRFYSLKSRWENDIRLLSDTNEICTHEAYQRIIGMGEKALPFIYFELQKEPDHWFWALKAITCEDPVPKEQRGNLQLMTIAWLKWFDGHPSRWAGAQKYPQFPMLVGRHCEWRSEFCSWAIHVGRSPLVAGLLD